MSSMELVFLLFGTATMFSLLVTPAVGRVARRVGALDEPGYRRVHARPTPRGGGVAVVLAAVGACLVAVYWSPAIASQLAEARPAVAMTVLAAGCLTVVGLVDDLLTLHACFKLVAVLGVSAAALLFGISDDVGGSQHVVLAVIGGVAALIWLAFVTVGINFVDGLDGLAPGTLLIACAATAIVAGAARQVAVAWMALALAGSVSGFLYFNCRAARIFLGDSGSLPLGFLVGWLPLVCAHRSGDFTTLVLPAVCLGIPILDAFLTPIRRGILQRRSLFAPELGHIHHCLLARGCNPTQAVVAIHGTTIIASISAATALWVAPAYPLLALLVGAATSVLLFLYAGAIRPTAIIAAVQRMRVRIAEARRLQGIFDEWQLRLMRTTDSVEWGERIHHAARSLGVQALCVQPTLVTPQSRPERNARFTDIVHLRVLLTDATGGEAMTCDLRGTDMEMAVRSLSLFSRLLLMNREATPGILAVDPERLLPARTEIDAEAAVIIGTREFSAQVSKSTPQRAT